MSGRGDSRATVGEVLQLIRSGRASTRSEVGRLTGLSRTAVASRLAPLMSSGLVIETDYGTSTGGRPPSQLRLDTRAGLVLAAAIGRSRTQLAVCDLAGRPLASADVDQAIGVGPDELMPTVTDRFADLLKEAGRSATDIKGAGLSIPGTVAFEQGASLDSPIMKGWDGIPLGRYLRPIAEVPTFVDNDANVMALSERHGHLERFQNAVLLKASTGLGAGVVAGGRLIRGAVGGAGEMGHTKTPAAEDKRCRCGEVGCLETVAAGWALVQAMHDRGRRIEHVRDLVVLALEGDPDARRMIRDSGRRTGEVLGGVVNILNPEAIVVGGDLARAYNIFVAGVRETLYSNATALATRELQFMPSSHGEWAGVIGCAALAIEHVLSIDAINRAQSD